MEEATYQSGALAVQDVVALAASLDPTPEVIHVALRGPSRNSYLGGKAWSTNLRREVRFQVRSVRFLHLLPQPATMDQLLNAMGTHPVGNPKDAHVQVYPTTNLVQPPPPPTWCAFMILLQAHHLTIPFFPSLGTLPTPGGRRIWAWPLSILPSNQIVISQTSSTQLSTAPLLCNGSGGPHVPPPSFQVNPPSALNPVPTPPQGVTGDLPADPNRVGYSQPPLNFVDGNGYIVLRGLWKQRIARWGGMRGLKRGVMAKRKLWERSSSCCSMPT